MNSLKCMICGKELSLEEMLAPTGFLSGHCCGHQYVAQREGNKIVPVFSKKIEEIDDYYLEDDDCPEEEELDYIGDCGPYQETI